MPTYDYKCLKCGHVREIRHSLLEGAKKLHLKCENCGGRKLEKVISAPLIMGSKSKSSGSDSCPTGTCPLS